MYFRVKGCNRASILTSNRWSFLYRQAINSGCSHDEAVNFADWAELAGPGECYDCADFYAEIEED